MRKLTTEEFVEKAKKVHSDKYDYSKVNYINSNTKVEIICKEHGSFWQRPSDHLSGHGCNLCSKEENSKRRTITTSDFIEKAKNIHDNKYDYSKTDYRGDGIKVIIICPIHGEFLQTPNAHLRGQGCPMCSGVKKLTREEFILRSIKLHGDKYDYSKVNYVNYRTKVCITCPIHGDFWQSPSEHLCGKGCYKCGHTHKVSKEPFIEKANKIHEYKYLYDKVDYVNNHTNVCITCPEHGDFWMTPKSHLRGAGCPICNMSPAGKIDESSIKRFIQKAKKIHGDKYDYSKVEYKGSKVKICINCPEHGEFWQTPSNHLKGWGCHECGKLERINKRKKTKELFVEQARKVHGLKYDYSKVEYINTDVKVCIICPEHGDFWQTPTKHLQKEGCPKCRNSKGELVIEKYLKNKNIEFEPQYSISIDYKMFSRNNIKVDFYLPKYNTIIEFHGQQHYKYIPFFHKNKDDFYIQVDRDERLRKYCKQRKINLIEIKYSQIDKIENILNKKINK